VTRRRFVRAALSEIGVRVEAEDIEMILHWQGGDHTALKLKKNGVGKLRWRIPADTLSLASELAIPAAWVYWRVAAMGP
jgi:hypothetical protein